jgi:phospholipid/cholesterol/gamma-HCH transport system substrate-binding protein
MPQKSKEHIQVQVGAFLAIGILLTMMAIFVLGSKTNIFQTYYSLICYFDDISGLRIGAPVQLAGINVGFISKIEFEERPVANESSEEGQSESTVDEEKKFIIKVKVAMKINQQFQDRIRHDSVASVVTQGLLGDRMIYITVGSRGKKILNDLAEIKFVKNPTGFTHLVEKGDDLMIDAKSFVQNADVLMENLNVVMGEVIKGDGLLHEVIFEKGSADSAASAQDILRNFKKVSQNFVSISNKINDGKGSLGALVNDDSLYHEVKLLLGKANRNRLVRSVIRHTLQSKDNQQLK